MAVRLVGSLARSTTTKRSSSVTDEPSDDRPFVRLFTDGACRGNPGPGGWAFILRHPASGNEMEQSGGLPETTNNQMELQAVISGLDTLKRPSKVEVVTDSTYVAKGCQEWMHGWKKRNWQRKRSKQLKPVKKANSSSQSRTLSSGRNSMRCFKSMR